jgi:hypothetical protein
MIRGDESIHHDLIGAGPAQVADPAIDRVFYGPTEWGKLYQYRAGGFGPEFCGGDHLPGAGDDLRHPTGPQALQNHRPLHRLEELARKLVALGAGAPLLTRPLQPASLPPSESGARLAVRPSWFLPWNGRGFAFLVHKEGRRYRVRMAGNMWPPNNGGPPW